MSGADLAAYFALEWASFLIPWVVGGVVVWVLGTRENNLWASKELVGALVAVDVFLPFVAVLYPDTFHITYVPPDLWTLRSAAWHALAYLVSYVGLTMVGIARWDWHQPDVWPWSLYNPS